MLGRAKQFNHLCLAQPHSIFRKLSLMCGCAIIGLLENYFSNIILRWESVASRKIFLDVRFINNIGPGNNHKIIYIIFATRLELNAILNCKSGADPIFLSSIKTSMRIALYFLKDSLQRRGFRKWRVAVPSKICPHPVELP